MPRLLRPGIVVPYISVQESAQLIATAFGLARVRVNLVQAPLPFDIGKVDINEGRPNGHRLALQVPRYDQVVELPVNDLHAYLLLKFQKAQNHAKALRADYHLAELAEFLLTHRGHHSRLVLMRQLLLLMAAPAEAASVLVLVGVFHITILLFEKLVVRVVERRVLLRAIVIIQKVIERIRMLQLLFFADYFALLILLLEQVLVLVVRAAAAGRGVLEVSREVVVVLRRGHITGVAQLVLRTTLLDYLIAIILRTP